THTPSLHDALPIYDLPIDVRNLFAQPRDLRFAHKESPDQHEVEDRHRRRVFDDRHGPRHDARIMASNPSTGPDENPLSIATRRAFPPTRIRRSRISFLTGMSLPRARR